MKILKATYGGKDCIEEIRSKVKNDKLVINVNNYIIGDPAIGKSKFLEITYEKDGVIEKSRIREGSVMMIPMTKTKRLGIFYTNNNLSPEVLDKSLATIKVASEKYETDILVSAWKPISNNPFHEIICDVKLGNHFNIIYQICTLLITASYIKDYDTVSFLEHDVLYGEDYFDIKPFSGNVVCNDNFIGFRKQGFQKKVQNDEPLHEITTKFGYTLNHFKNLFPDSIVRGVNLEPSHTPPYGKRKSKTPSVHINDGPHLTSHYNIYANQFTDKDRYWGDASSLAKILNL